MTVDLDLGGRSYRVAVTPTGGRGTGSRLRIVLTALDDGQVIERDIDVRATTDGYTWVESDGRVVDAAVSTTGARDQWLVQLSGADVDVAMSGRRHPSADAGGAGGGEQRVVAPMPGRVLRVLVASGETVVAGQALVVIEAMKMENALTALCDGVVAEVAVSDGTSVEAGRLLLRLC
jgi:biotin carboxyl carrier protein